MKIRQGFVSNSSTSNFLVYGFKAPYRYSLDEDVREFNTKTGLKFGCLYGVPRDRDVVIGKIFFDVSSDGGDYIDFVDIDQTELRKMDKIAEEYSDYITNVFGADSTMHLLAGTKSS